MSFSSVPPKAGAPRFLAQAKSDMYQVYVLRSLKNGKRYVGMTSQDLVEKLKEHNYGATQWTKRNKPFELAYSLKFEDKSEALKKEKFFKTGGGRRVLDRLVGK